MHHTRSLATVRTHQSRLVKILSALAVVAFLAAFATSASPTAAPYSPGKTPANVAGTWEVQLTGDTGATTQTLVITQKDDTIAGTFKGPGQSGSLEGSLDGNAIKFQLHGRFVLMYTGNVTGDTMNGTLTAQGKNGSWTAHRTKAG
jgi:hypothetical protein